VNQTACDNRSLSWILQRVFVRTFCRRHRRAGCSDGDLKSSDAHLNATIALAIIPHQEATSGMSQPESRPRCCVYETPINADNRLASLFLPYQTRNTRVSHGDALLLRVRQVGPLDVALAAALQQEVCRLVRFALQIYPESDLRHAMRLLGHKVYLEARASSQTEWIKDKGIKESQRCRLAALSSTEFLFLGSFRIPSQ